MRLSSIDTLDIYLSVIDNFGDMGFALNFAIALHARNPHLVFRFFSDDFSLFSKLFHGEIPHWISYEELSVLSSEDAPPPAEYICSFFDYPFPKAYLARFPYEKTVVSFSYFLLHPSLHSLHGTTYVLEDGYTQVIHFIPSLLPSGGGIITHPILHTFFTEDTISEERKKDLFLQELGIVSSLERAEIIAKKWVSVFCYKDMLHSILPIFRKHANDTVFWVCGEVPSSFSSPSIRSLPFLSLENYARLQFLSDANIVRGENSACQALLIGKPLLWDIYKESNGAHIDKIDDFLQYIRPYFQDDAYEQMARSFMRGERYSIENSSPVSGIPQLPKGLPPGSLRNSSIIGGLRQSSDLPKFKKLASQNIFSMSSLEAFLCSFSTFGDIFQNISKDIRKDSDLIVKFESILQEKGKKKDPSNQR